MDDRKKLIEAGCINVEEVMADYRKKLPGVTGKTTDCNLSIN